MLGRIRHVGRVLSVYAGKVGQTAKLVGDWLTATADLIENLAGLWSAHVDDVHSESAAGSEQAASGAGTDSRRKGESEISNGDKRERAVQRGARVLDGGTRRRGIPPEAEAAQKGGQDDTDGAEDLRGADEATRVAGATA